MSELLVVNGGRVLPRLGPTFIVETGMIRPATAFNGAAIASSADATFFRVFPRLGGSLTSIQPYFNTSGSTPAYDANLYADVDGEPSGSALASITNITPANGAFGADAAWTSAPTIVANTPYWIEILWRAGTFQLGYNPGAQDSHAEARYTTTVASPVQDTVWRDRQRISIPVRFNYADGSQWTNILGSGVLSNGDVGIYGDPDGANGRMNGWRFKMPWNCYLLGNDIAVSSIYADTGLAGTIVERVYRVGETSPFRFSSNTIAASSFGASNSNRFKQFKFADLVALERGDYRSLVKIHKNREYEVLVCPSIGTSSDSSNRFALNGSVGTAYPYAPLTTDENSQGFVSLQTSTGKANVAVNTTTGYWGRFEFAIAGSEWGGIRG